MPSGPPGKPSGVLSLAEPRARGERAALSVLLAARRSAVEASTNAQRQLHALVVMAPEVLRDRFRGKTTLQMVDVTCRLRSNSSWDLETRTTAEVLRSLGRRSRTLGDEEVDIKRNAEEDHARQTASGDLPTGIVGSRKYASHRDRIESEQGARQRIKSQTPLAHSDKPRARAGGGKGQRWMRA